MAMVLTELYIKVPEGYVAFVEEVPEANTQGATPEEARANLHEAVDLEPLSLVNSCGILRGGLGQALDSRFGGALVGLLDTDAAHPRPEQDHPGEDHRQHDYGIPVHGATVYREADSLA